MEITLTLDVLALKNEDVNKMYDRLYDEMRRRKLRTHIIPTRDELTGYRQIDLTHVLEDVTAEMTLRGMPIPSRSTPALLPFPALDNAEMALVRVGDKIGAIKHYRDRVSREFKVQAGLKDSKDMIDAYNATLPKDLLDRFGKGSPNF
jgi:hypothetical protein